MNFKAQDTYEQAVASKFGKWICDFYLTFKGAEGGVFSTEGCYLAGNYGSFGWIVIPAEAIATELECDVAYPIVAAYDANLTYENICDYVKDFTAAIYITPELLIANPNFEVTLELRMTNPENSDDYMVIGEPAVYGASDLYDGIQKGEDITDLESNTQIGGEVAEENIDVDSAKDALVEAFPELAPEQIENATIELQITVEDVVITEEAPSSYSYNVAPMFGIDDKQVKISELVEAITFRLPIHSKETKKAANVYHNGVLMGTYEIKEENGEKFVEISSASFSTFTVEPVIAYVAEVNGVKYENIVEAFADAQKYGYDITLLSDVSVTEFIALSNSITINGNGHKFSSNATRVFRITKGNVTIVINELNIVNTGTVVYPNDIRGISVDSNISNVNLTLNNVTVDFTDASAFDWSYAINFVGNSANHVLNVNGGSYEGANVINVWGDNHEINIDGATLTSLYAFNRYYFGGCVRLEGVGADINVKDTVFNGDHAVVYSTGSGASGWTVSEENVTNNTKRYVVSVDDQPYHTLADAIAAANGKTVVILADIELAEGVVIEAGMTVTLELNGNVISGLTVSAGASAVITNYGTLNIQDSVGGGKITAMAQNPDTSDIPSYANNTISNSGTLNLYSGTIENSTGDEARACFPIDNNSSVGRNAILNIYGGTVSGRGAIRQFTTTANYKNVVNIYGGTIYGRSYAIWLQNPVGTGGNATGELYISGGELSKILLESSSNFKAAITGGYVSEVAYWSADYANPERLLTGFISGGSFGTDVSEFCKEGFGVEKNENGTYDVSETTISIEYTNVVLNQNFKISFAFSANAVSDWSGYYVVITKTSLADGSETSIVVPSSMWAGVNIGGAEYAVVEYAGVTAMELGDVLSVVIYNADGVAVSDVKTDSIKDYAMRKLNKSTDAELSTLLVDILNYGAEAQIFFNYATDKLVNAELTDEQKAFATLEREYSGEAYDKVFADGYDFNVGSTLSLENNIQIKIGLDLRALNLSDDAKVIVSYVDQIGNTVTKTVSVADYKNEIVYVTCDTLTALDHNAPVNFSLVDGETVILSYTTSIEAFTARLSEGNNKTNICLALMKYCDSAEVFANKK